VQIASGQQFQVVLPGTGWPTLANMTRESCGVSTTHFDDFLREATTADPGSEKGLGEGQLFGLYTSWCALSGCPPESADALWAGLRARGIVPRKNTLSMTGPAAADYILSSAPDLI
jgi:hypothetical protein